MLSNDPKWDILICLLLINLTVVLPWFSVFFMLNCRSVIYISSIYVSGAHSPVASLQACLSVCLSVYFSVFLPDCLTAYMTVCLSVCLTECQAGWLSTNLPVCLISVSCSFVGLVFVCLFVFLFDITSWFVSLLVWPWSVTLAPTLCRNFPTELLFSNYCIQAACCTHI